MSEVEGCAPGISIRIVYSDPPDLIELETTANAGVWRGSATAYASPAKLSKDAAALAAWSRNPTTQYTLEAGKDTGIGWLLLVFVPRGKAGHLTCRVTLAASYTNHQDEDAWRLSLSMRTEPGLVERFAQQLLCLLSGMKDEARLEGLAV
jgi:hypothetical protein